MSLSEARLTKDPARTDFTTRRWGSRGPFGALALVLMCAPLLSACGGSGFSPLYGSLGAQGGTVSERLASVDIAPIPGRVGQRIRNELIFGTTGGANKVTPAYRLEIAVRETVTSALVEREGEARAKVYNIDATFRLIELSSNQVAFEGRSFGRAGYERFNSIFSNVRARKDAEDRAADTVATDLKTRLSAYLATAA